jgi:hypothetical protein
MSMRGAKGMLHHNRKINPEIADLIRHLHENNAWGYKRLAKKFELGVRTIRDIIEYKTWNE